MEITLEEIRRPAANGEGEVFSRIWKCAAPKGVFQIAHGMCEHSARYDAFAREIASMGYIVCANDHAGHGNSDMGHLGTFALKKNGFEYVLQDMKSLFEYVESEFKGLPRVLFGHSMGSILSGIYADRWGKSLSALILMGTPAPNPAVGMGIFIAKADTLFHGYTYVSKMLCSQLAKSCGEAGSTPEERKSWLSRDASEVKKYVGDPKCGFDFSASANGEMAKGLKEFTSNKWGFGVPDIPVLIIAGEEDPVGAKGKGPKYYYSNLKLSGNTKVKLYLVAGARHELLNETNKAETIGFIKSWLSETEESSVKKAEITA